MLPLKFNFSTCFLTFLHWIAILPHSTKQSHFCMKVPNIKGTILSCIILIPKERYVVGGKRKFSSLPLLIFKNYPWPIHCFPSQVFEWIINCKLDPWTKVYDFQECPSPSLFSFSDTCLIKNKCQSKPTLPFRKL